MKTQTHTSDSDSKQTSSPGRVKYVPPPPSDRASNEPDLILTLDLINRCRSDNGQFTGATARALGAEWPLMKGWMFALVGRKISPADYRDAIGYRNRDRSKGQTWIARSPGQRAFGFDV